jgi:hypothetical protein
MEGQVDWLRNVLAVAGSAAALDAFREAAAGSGVIPWTLDLDQMEEDFFLPMAAPGERGVVQGSSGPPDHGNGHGGGRAISLAGARILARRLRDAAADNHQRALARRESDRSCPLDLHRLIPIPQIILALGPDDPTSRAWLAAHWGTPRPLRHVRETPARQDRRRGRAEMRVEFWSADWSPWAALQVLQRDFAELRFELQPDYADQNA